MRLSMTGMAFAAIAVAASCACAYDADTIAFYPFKEGVPGTSAAGVMILNDAGGSHAGTVTMSTDTGVVYHADVPGKYILASSFAANPTPEILYTNPGSVHFWDTGKISFAGLSTAISSNDDYTIEFFYKIQAVDQRGASTVQWGTPLKYNVGTWFKGGASNPEGFYPTYLMRSTDTYWQMYYVAYSAGGTLAASLPYSSQSGWSGEWHHMALVYSKDTRTLTAWSDYGARGRKESLSNLTNSVLEASEPVELGSGFRGLVSCLRVSKRALAPDYFLHASHLDAYPETTVFHYKLDGVAGEGATMVTNYAYGGHPYAGQFQDWDPARQMKLYSGNAVTTTATSTNSLGEDVTVSAEWSALRAFNKALVDDGTGAAPYENVGSGHFHSLERMHQPQQLGGAGIYLDGANYQHVNSGSFTFEITMKLDYAEWSRKMHGKFLRYPIFLMYGNSSYPFECQLAAIMDGDNCFRVDANAYFPAGHALKTVAHCNGDVNKRENKNLLKDGKWYHFAFVYDDSTYTFRTYINYVLKDEKTFESPYRPSYSYQHIWIGDGGTVNLSSFEGWIDEVRMTRKALSPEQFISFRSHPGTLFIMK